MPLDEADIKKISDLIGAALKPETIGAVVKAHVDGLKIGELVGAEVRKAVEALPKPEAKGDNDTGTKGGNDPAAAQRIAALEKKIQEEQEARRTAEQRARMDRLHSEARAALLKSGVPQDRVHLALAAIKDGGSLVVADDGTLGWKGKDRYGVDTTLSLEDGARAWASTADGKAFLPPTGHQGTGDGAGGTGGSSAAPSVPKREDGTYDLSVLGGRLGAALANL